MLTVNFFEPPADKTVGGLDAAIRSLEDFLRSAGIAVRKNPELDELGRAGGPEVVHFHGLWEPKFIKVSSHCRRSGIPYVVSPHGMLEPWARRHKWWKKRLWFRLFERPHLAGAARLLTTSRMEADNLRDLFPASACVALPLGLTAEARPGYADARRALGWDEDEVVLLYLSRIHPKKGLHLLLRSLADVTAPAKPMSRLVIVGGGEQSYVRGLKEFAEAKRARLPKVEWAGEVWGEEKWKYFQGSDLFCLTTFSENFGLAVLEALQVGTRVLTSTETPWTELPAWGAGFVCEPAEAAVRRALEGFFAAPVWTEMQRGRLAESIRAKFAWETVGPAYISFYEDACRADGARLYRVAS